MKASNKNNGEIMLKKIKVKNFRSLDNFCMTFNNGLNVIIGENDAGKTSLIDSMKILLNGDRIDLDDFRDKSKEVIIELETNDEIYKMTIQPEGLRSILESKPSKEKCEKIHREINSEEFAEKLEEEQRKILKEYCKTFAVTYRSNAKIEKLITNLNTKIEELTENNSFIEPKEIEYPISFLGSRTFENTNSFFDNTFFKELKQNIWNHKIENKSIKDHLTTEINKFKDDALNPDNIPELYENLSEFLPDFKKIDVTIEPDPKMNLNITVNLLNSKNQKISLEKMGDGTNRRTTMAIFKHKRDKDDLCYVFDEPDTHLHIKAQLEIFNLFKDLTKDNKQVIITTHSPFLINEVNPNDIKLMFLDSNNKSNVKSLTEDTEPQFLNELGITNLDLFFTNKLIIVEGESEQLFLPHFYHKIYGLPISHHFVKIVKAEGITEIPKFVRIIKNAFSNTNIFIMMDNDANENTENKLQEIIDQYDDLSQNQVFRLGEDEFEDSFTDEVLIKSINDYLDETNETDARITSDDINRMRNSSDKFSKEINRFIHSNTHKSLKKPLLAKHLANNANKENVDENILKLFELIG